MKNRNIIEHTPFGPLNIEIQIRFMGLIRCCLRIFPTLIIAFCKTRTREYMRIAPTL